ncbi:MAG TPA: hypothetical protein ENJ85_05015 [Oceanithermus profundus]|uniref:Uncharacterized protein n=1 Tax=Oceanithermus profundus TaxID=187137 RepID=A0A7C5WTL8_9DEIN|nr:hypothetical protein [Oceanithermus profundus]
MTPLEHFLAALIGLRDLYQLCHWNAPGASRYQEHLLFMRLYETASDDVDRVAERCVGLLRTRLTPRILGSLRDVWSRSTAAWPPTAGDAREATVAVTNLARDTLRQMREASKLTPGVEDLLQSTASHLEEAQYLLTEIA